MAIKKQLGPLVILYVAASFFSVAHSSEGCPIEFREHRQQQTRSEALLDSVPSVLEQCALGPRLASIQNPRILRNFNLSFDEQNFFCGFGTQDVWRIATMETSMAEFESLNNYLSNMSEKMNEMIQTSEIPLPWTSRTIPTSKAYKHIFGAN